MTRETRRRLIPERLRLALVFRLLQIQHDLRFRVSRCPHQTPLARRREHKGEIPVLNGRTSGEHIGQNFTSRTEHPRQKSQLLDPVAGHLKIAQQEAVAATDRWSRGKTIP
ncbi:hypothetical protein [Pannonibacter phragmitetus]|uniref:hypothetical protein n=1 Tax=Pannonibacter phragmitetus TaxID=121719 RepID=UPI000F44CB33|nr:hypothetical protein [Pannonibacter phragmitetus]MBA4206657.1 hypothetical protein [Polymorphum sp.]